jgi:hypothetical protein
MNFRSIGAAALSLLLATPAMAMHHGYHHHLHKESPVQNAPQFGYGSTYGAYNFYPEHDFAPGDYDDFDRRNIFN